MVEPCVSREGSEPVTRGRGQSSALSRAARGLPPRARAARGGESNCLPREGRAASRESRERLAPAARAARELSGERRERAEAAVARAAIGLRRLREPRESALCERRERAQSKMCESRERRLLSRAARGLLCEHAARARVVDRERVRASRA
ncbi:hypothetical protein Syun_007768 [Stephania yunnanensis]|uniref:Uncharacterized protein n=1 Tax=Stephania yunnanensis TaxID=152371 RepID=A0AAP0KZ08_9MAGN